MQILQTAVSSGIDPEILKKIVAMRAQVHLKADVWASGEINWLLDMIAPDQKTTTSVIANFKQVIKDGDLRLHPIISRLVDAETLQKMGRNRPLQRMCCNDLVFKRRCRPE
ncbi:hypothetical protein ROA7450_03297 [Roseovarius albus]|uniref:Uncharacterized protein n=1 Tax=Roseovarius albus TaxID=1247867 RepID=A0A1X6ZVK6_9RHOB|nr:hypothetical protein [Roseovarius albus]SLN63113.1 hypothetical protein ROA7450_03297 [Roseovarius albus]